jgi:hypothetical protein
MLLVIDRDNTICVYESVRDAEADLETIDVELGEYQFCDDAGQPYVGDVLQTVEKFTSGAFRIVPRGKPDPHLPTSFLARATDYRSRVRGLKTLDDARRHFAIQET